MSQYDDCRKMTPSSYRLVQYKTHYDIQSDTRLTLFSPVTVSCNGGTTGLNGKSTLQKIKKPLMAGNKEGEEGEWNWGNTRVNRRHSLMESFSVVSKSVPPLICVPFRRFKKTHYFFKTCLLLILCLFTALRSELLDQNRSVTTCSKTTLTKLWFSCAKWKNKTKQKKTKKKNWNGDI